MIARTRPHQKKLRSPFTVPKILIVGGGYAGFYTAWKLETIVSSITTVLVDGSTESITP